MVSKGAVAVEAGSDRIDLSAAVEGFDQQQATDLVEKSLPFLRGANGPVDFGNISEWI